MKNKRLLTMLLIFALSFVMTNNTVTSAASKYYDMTVHYIDVGESDSVLIQSNGHSMLIDAGDTDDDETIIKYLKSKKVKKLDYIICTHPHADHIGGMDGVIKMFDVGKIIMPDKTHTTRVFEALLDTIEDKGLKITKPIVGTKYTIGKASFTILAPNNYDYGDNLNNYSIATRLVNGKTSFLFTGDCEETAIEDIIDNGKTIDSDVYMCGHHGSSTSTTKELLKAVTPDFAVISVGNNSYGHPNEETLELLAEKDIITYRTDESGTIVATSTGKSISFNTDPSDLKPTSDNSLDSMVVYVTKTGTKYHLEGCRTLKSSKIKTTVKDAKEKGYDPCGICNSLE